MTSISENVYIDKLDDTVNKCSYKYYGTIKMKLVNVKSNTCINSSKETNDKVPEFNVGNIFRISKYKNIFAKGYFPKWSEKGFAFKRIKNTVPWTYVINGVSGEEIFGTFYEKELQKPNLKKFRVKK